jgi:hypothetical protein
MMGLGPISFEKAFSKQPFKMQVALDLKGDFLNIVVSTFIRQQFS